MKNLKNIAIIILILFSLYYIYDIFTREKEIIEVPVKIEVPVPSIENTSDTIYLPFPSKTIKIENPINNKLQEANKELIAENKLLIKTYEESDSVTKDSIYKKSITIKEYNEVFKDTFKL
jgi:hypothetical protein